MRTEMTLEIQGLGIILYSPFALAHVAEGQDFLTEHFWEPSAVAAHVMSCALTAFGTGGPGRYNLTFDDGPRDESAVRSAACAIRLGIEIRDGTLCVRDLYDLMEWSSDCPARQRVAFADGFHLLTVYTSPPPSGIFGDDQAITIHAEPVAERPRLRWTGVPDLTQPSA